VRATGAERPEPPQQTSQQTSQIAFGDPAGTPAFGDPAGTPAFGDPAGR